MRLKFLTLFALLSLPLFGFQCQWPIAGDDPVAAPPPNPNSIPFAVSVDADLCGGTPGVDGDICATCSPVLNPNTGSPATYKLTVDGVSRGGATGTNTFFVQSVPPRAEPGYPVICVHETSNSRSDADYVVVP